MQQTNYLLLGERCSGTNIIAQYLHRNLGMKPTSGICFKHFPPKKISQTNQNLLPLRDLPAVLVVRDPVQWLQSFWQKPWHLAPEVRAQEFSSFIRSPCWSVYDESSNISTNDPSYGCPMGHDLDPETGKFFLSPIDLRRSKHERFLLLLRMSRSSFIVRLEDFQKNQADALVKIAETTQVDFIPNSKKIVTYKGNATFKRRLVIRLGLGRILPSQESKRKRPEVSSSDREYIWSQLRLDLEAKLGYTNRI